MKNKIFKIIPIIFILLALLSVNIYAVTYSSTDCTVKSEGTITITVKASENVQNYDLTLTSYNGLTFVSCSANENAAVNTTTGAISYATLGTGITTLGTYTFKAPKVTEDTTYNVVFDINGISNTAKVVVEAEKVIEPEPETPTAPETPQEPETPTTPSVPETPTEPEKPETPVVTEPKFTDVNRTMYTTRDCNLRASWSINSTATSIKEGTELKVTGTSTEKIDGYVWYRVNYDGKTKYIANYLLTDAKPEEEEKSNNANLKSLVIENQELIPTFNKETTEYTMQVTNDITELNITAEAEDEKSTIEIQGNKDLKEGENTITISVNAEDNTIKIYEIKVTRLAEITLGLESLTIKGTDISEIFKTDVYEYKIDIEEVTELEIEAIANDETATVEILGNEDLQEGENIITIIVSSEDGEEKVTYQIKANKLVAKVQPVVDEKKEIDTKIYFYIAIAAILLIALIIVIVYVIKNRNNVEGYTFTGNYEEFEEEYPEEFPEELPERKQPKNDNNYFLDANNDEEGRNRRGKHF